MKARTQAKIETNGKVLCEGCIEELARRIDETYKFRFLLAQAQKRLQKLSRIVKSYNHKYGRLNKEDYEYLKD